MKTKLLLSLVPVLLLFAGCSTSSRQFVAYPDQEKVVEDAGKARIYIFRKEDSYRGQYPVLVVEGEKEIGELGTGGWLCWERAPGVRQVRLVLRRGGLEPKNWAGYSTAEGREGVARHYLVEITVTDSTPKMKEITPAHAAILLREGNAPAVGQD